MVRRPHTGDKMYPDKPGQEWFRACPVRGLDLFLDSVKRNVDLFSIESWRCAAQPATIVLGCADLLRLMLWSIPL